MLSKKMIWRAACLAALIFLPACGAGDDDGRRLGDIIVGTWQRGWGEGDVVIEGTSELNPEDFSYDGFYFLDDGPYNGMVRKGTFSSWDIFGNPISKGSYQCDNNNMKLEFRDSEGVDRKILAQVVTFTEDTIWLKYEDETYHITVTFVIRKA